MIKVDKTTGHTYAEACSACIQNEWEKAKKLMEEVLARLQAGKPIDERLCQNMQAAATGILQPMLHLTGMEHERLKTEDPDAEEVNEDQKHIQSVIDQWCANLVDDLYLNPDLLDKSEGVYHLSFSKQVDCSLRRSGTINFTVPRDLDRALDDIDGCESFRDRLWKYLEEADGYKFDIELDDEEEYDHGSETTYDLADGSSQ